MVTVITKTIGPSGRDYASFTLAEADVENIGTSADLVANDEAIVFEADAGDYSESLQFLTGGALTCDATRNVTWTHAAGAEHGGQFESGAHIIGFALIQEDFAVVDGLSVSPATGAAVQVANGVVGVILRDLMSYSTSSNAVKLSRGGTAAAPCVVENCVAKSDSTRAFDIRSDAQAESHWRIVNCTAMATGINQGFIVGQSSTGNTIYLELVNNVVIGGTTRSYFPLSGPTYVVTGSNNFGPDDGSAPFPVAVQGSPYPITATADTYNPGAAGDYALYDSTTGKLIYSVHNDVVDQGVGPASNSDVPTTDINGVARSGATANPGAFEELYVIAPTVISKTIGPSGRDYASFTLAEADVTNIGTSADLLNENERIVFEADAGTYSENVIFESTLTTDATRQVTYKAAAGSEHEGLLTQGVRVNGMTITRDSFTVLDALVLYRTAAAGTHRAENGEGITYRNVITNTGSGGETFHALNVVSARYENCVAHTTPGVGKGWRFDVVTRSATIDLVNCTDMNPYRSIFMSVKNGYDAQVNIVNFLSLSPRGISVASSGGGTYTLTGSNNFGPTDNPFPAALQASGQTWTFTTDTDESTSPSTGSQVVYDATTGALVNSPNNDAVGEGTPTGIPTTDISGADRIRGTYADPGAFTTELLTLNRTIGATGRDYATFIAAEADVVNITTNGNLQQRNERIVFEADAGTYSESVTFQSTLTTDATRQVTYKPAAGSEHGGLSSAGVRLTTTGSVLTVSDYFTALDGLVVDSAASNGIRNNAADGVLIRNCIINAGGQGIKAGFSNTGTAVAPFTVENCVITSAGRAINFAAQSGGSGPQYFAVRNCTLKPTGTEDAILTSNSADTNYGEFTNNLVLGSNAYNASGSNAITGSNNFGGSSSPFPVAIQGSPYPITPTADTYNPGVAGDYALYDSASGKLIYSVHNDVVDQGVGPASNSDVPTTDILGNARSGLTANPGAFEELYVIAPTVITRTIGATGRDYASFTLAEADVENIGTSADLLNDNERIVFEADAGTYSEHVVFQSTLTTDATRQVTYKPAAGSEHGGVAGAGVRIQFGNLAVGSNCVSIKEAFTALDGLELDWTDVNGNGRTLDINLDVRGVSISNCLIRYAGTGRAIYHFQASTYDLASYPVTITNCAVYAPSGDGAILYNYGASDEAFTVTNCTFTCSATSGRRAIQAFTNDAGYTTTLTLTNNLVLAGGSYITSTGGSGVVTVLGSNNFGGSTDPFPVALQGSPYPISVTTSTDPGVGDFAIVDADTGQLINDSDNDVINQGIGPAANSDVPTTGIAGGVRSGATTHPGAFATLLSAPPALSGTPTVSDLGNTEATISWTTTVAATSRVVYGTSSGALTSTESGSAGVFVTGHSLTLTGLTAGTQFFYRVEGEDQYGGSLTGATTEFTFTTIQIVEPVVDPDGGDGGTAPETSEASAGDRHECFRSTPDGSAIPCGPPTTTLGGLRAWNNRPRKLLIISIGQSNNGLTAEDGSAIDDGPGGVDAPDPSIFELSYEVGRRANEPIRDWVGPLGTRHVFQHPAQDEQGEGTGGALNTAVPNGICMRLPAAKAIKAAFPNVTEITLFCGAVSNTALQDSQGRGQWEPGPPTATNRKAAKERVKSVCGQYMRDNPDHDVVFMCSLGETDGVQSMGLAVGDSPAAVKQAYSEALAALAAELRSSIPGAERALWIQADIPADYPNRFGPEIRSHIEAVIQAQQEVREYIPLSVPVTIFDLSTFDQTHLDRASLRTMGLRMAAATSF